MYCTYIQLLGKDVYCDVNNNKHEPHVGTPRNRLQITTKICVKPIVYRHHFSLVMSLQAKTTVFYFRVAMTDTHINSSNSSNPYQSAYRKFHSTETALLKIHNDMLASMDAGRVTALILLDLSAACDTVDHTLLLSRLDDWFGDTGKALDWFKSYFTCWCQRIKIGDCLSSKSRYEIWSPSGVSFGSSAFHALYHSIEQHDLWRRYPSPPLCWQQPASCFICIRGLCSCTKWFAVMFGLCPVMDVDQ